MSLRAVILAAGPNPDNDEARQWLRDELDKARYQESKPGLVERISDWISDRINSFTDAISGSSPHLPNFVVVLVILAIIGGIAYAMRFVRRTRRVRTAPDPGALGPSTRSAAELRSMAEHALSDGNHDEVVHLIMRAIAARARERTLLPGEATMTAHEVSTALARHFPAQAAETSWLAGVFDGVVYGSAHAGPDDARRAVDLERTLDRTTPHTRTTLAEPVS
ncbi:DUF4129 domain-containing protein [Gordonia amarae]|uniref:Protein-glutamine gamma-glutamyltransferase-like C-terminal domain-containing protein n=2 Tax=Gordonia amarae TaxID=36821 RepID=G7GKW5_9ACTN|nr:DUF4129 domain-containing protein [Gordonia amarae]MCS3876810.1 hypothetical protein [Gordonia amarae]QHN15653.1 DUF4129 domain-containing protein [Gordonia amarae]QHN20222.1 DUF4129 domain-containing protein [Gordonia amarae]QHN37853.1 DUF4129 domain-containing protein [Gordonia amarae]GAB04240.1 hypothetical protein GOAMR_15_00220 [Gordonia amarae NBRC 15530]